MKSVIKSAKTVDEAVKLGLKDLGLTKNDVEIEILEEAKSGFLGIFGAQDAIVKISEKEDFKIDINDIYGEKEEEALRKSEESKRLAEEAKKTQEEKRAEEAKRLEASRKLEAEKKAIQAKKQEEARKAQEQRKLDEEKRAQEQQKPKQADSKEHKQKESVLNEDFDKEERDEISTMSEGDTEETKVTKLADELLEEVKTNLEDILKQMHIVARVEADLSDNSLSYNLVDISEEDTGIIIGRKGETLDSLQYILSLMANKNSSDFYRVSLNVANYRTRRKEAIENNARKVAFKVIKTKKPIALDPMNSYERRIVHYALQKYKEVETVSQGNFPNRKVIIKYKN